MEKQSQRNPSPKERLRSLTQTGETIFVDMHSKPKKYYISGEQLLRTAKYEASHDNQQKAYVLFVRFLTLFVEKLPKHPQYNTVGEEEIRQYRKYVKEAMEIAEKLKGRILCEFEEEFARVEEERRSALLGAPNGHGQPLPATTPFDAVVQRISHINAQPGQPSAPPVDDEPADYSWPNSSLQSADQVFGQRPGATGVPSFDRWIKPTPRLSQSDLLRRVVVAADLVSRFIEAARENTHTRNIETCANLWGIRKDGAYVITHLLIPKQKATDSYCEDLDEGSQAQYAISRDLVQLGWIHTHPTQSAFLSSVDLHMQWGYQVMLPEALAIVVAPSYDDVAFFRLDSYGMELIGQCPHGTHFHSHDTTQPLFQRIDDITFDSSLVVECEDFRST